MKNKILKMLIFIIITILVISILNVKLYATDEVISGAQEFLEAGRTETLNVDNVKAASNSLFNIFSVVGTVIVIAVGLVLGLQFIMGSIEEKVKVKEALIPYSIGSIVIFGAFAIWKIVLIAMNSISPL